MTTMQAPPAATTMRLVSVENYLVGEEQSQIKHEYLGGYVYAMAGARTAHNQIAMAFLLIVGNALRGKPCQPFTSDMKVRIQSSTSTRFYYPDGMVVCEPNAGNPTFQDRPVIIAEVLSASTRSTDEREKLLAYQTIPTLSAYLIIESTLPRITVHRRTADGFVAERYDGLGAKINLEAVAATLSLAELYERVDFEAAKSDDVDPDGAAG